MSHSPLFDRLGRSLRRAFSSENTKSGQFGRRQFLQAAIGAGVAASRLPAATAPNVSVGIVGAGLAGLCCAYELQKKGLSAQLFEASDRAGGRCFSMDFGSQTIERGGELIDTAHKTMIGYAREFGLAREEITKVPGDVSYRFNEETVLEAEVVNEFRAFVPAMKADLRTLSNAPTALANTPADVALDNISLAEYLQTRGASPKAYGAIEQAYIAEYGLAAAEQSCLNFLLFIHADRRSKFTPFGVFSDERYHIITGNDGIAKGLAQRLVNPVRQGKRLVAVTKQADERIQLSFADSTSAIFDVVVLAIPFTVLRDVAFNNFAMPPQKINAIQNLGYGNNAKMMLRFQGPFWRGLGSNGASYSDLANHQATWETNPSRATATQAVLTDYSGAERGRTLKGLADPVSPFLADLAKVFPGGTYTDAYHLEHWPSNSLTKGSYTCYKPGQFTTIAGWESAPVGNLLFAGEHTNSFYEWQGFMEGALLSGIDAAAQILKPKR